MKKIASFVIVLCAVSVSFCQSSLSRPKLVVGIVVDQMRWDYLYRYYDRFDAKGGFKRLISEGFSCDNTFIPYLPTYTACGHSSIFSGSVPALSGISGNEWWDNVERRTVYCTEDNSVSTVGSSSTLGRMSPRNMLVTSVCDELRLATNFRSKVIGIAIKDRGGILPAGHSANAAYWFDNTIGNWISSTYYMKELPKWVRNFNRQKLPDRYFKEGWSLLFPADTYMQSTEDEKKYESKPFGNKFPYDLKKFPGKNYSWVPVTPYGNTLTVEFAKSAILNEQLGIDDITDFLTVSFSAPDYIGHTFGPNSLEAEDTYLRLDKELGDLLDFLDAKVGTNQYTVFLSADHGATQIPEFLAENKLPGGRIYLSTITESLNKILKERYRIDEAIVSDGNYQLYLNHQALDSAKANKKEIEQWIIDNISPATGIYRAFLLDEINTISLPGRLREMINNGYNPRRNGDIAIILQPGYIDAYSSTGTTHGLWNPYDSHIPLLFYGWGIKPGKINRETYMVDIAPTIAALLHIQMPSGCIGHVIEEVINR